MGQDTEGSMSRQRHTQNLGRKVKLKKKQERPDGGRLEETIPYTMVRKIFTTRNNKSTREVGEGREGSELCGEQQAKRTQRHCKSFSLLEW